jgi:integrase
MASVWRHPRSQYWTACFRDQNGRQRRVSTKETKRRAAQQIADAFEKAARQKRTLKQVQATIERLQEEFYPERAFRKATVRSYSEIWLKTKGPEVSLRTLTFYRKNVSKFLSFLGERAELPIAEIQKPDIVAYRNQLAGVVSARTANHDLKCVRMLFLAAKRDGYLLENPTEFVDLVKNQPSAQSKHAFSIPELQRVLSVADPEWQSMILFALYTGQRLGDIARLCWANVDLTKNEVRLTTSKTGRLMLIPMAAPLRKHVLALPQSDSLETPIHPKAFAIVEAQGRSGSLSVRFAELLSQAGLRPKKSHHKSQDGQGRSAPRIANALSFHSLRRTATTLLHEAGIPQQVVQALIGHDSEAMHQIYVAVGEAALKKAVAKFPKLL